MRKRSEQVMGIGYAIKNMIGFSAQYCLIKCIKTMLLGMATLPFVFLIRQCNRSKKAEINFYAMFLLLPAGISGMNKLFYLSRVVYISVYLNYYIKPIHGEIYFGVMTVLLAAFLWKNYRMKKRVRLLPNWEDPQLADAIAYVTSEKPSGWKAHYLERVKVYVTEECISPFSGGLFHPYIVMPRRLLADWTPDELRIVLCHELMHLKAGHIFWMICFRLLKIYWWGNPLIYLCEKKLLDDMEMVCDEQCVCCADVSRGTYSRTLLSMAVLMQGAGAEGILCFSGQNDFQKIKNRITSLLSPERRLNGEQQGRRYKAVFTVAVGLLFSAVIVTSYPKYTMLDELVLYDESTNMLDYNSAELCRAVHVVEDRLVIDQEKFREILTEKDVQGEYVYVSFGCIMKLPGTGGGGNAGMVAVADCDDIFYLRADSLENDIMEFWLKYMI